MGCNLEAWAGQRRRGRACRQAGRTAKACPALATGTED